VSADALRTLAAATDNDIRSCLNTLQFVRAEATRTSAHDGDATGGADGLPRFRVTTDMITRAAVGLKDQTRALYDVLGAVFQKPDFRSRASAALQSETSASAPGVESGESDGGDGGGSGEGAAGIARRHELFAHATSAVRAAHFSELMGQVRNRRAFDMAALALEHACHWYRCPGACS